MRRRGIPGAGSWFVSKKMAGGGPLIDLGVHVLDMALFLLGEPEVLTVSAMTYNHLGSNGTGFDPRSRKTGSGNAFEVEDLGTAFIRLANGATLLLESSWATHSSAGDDFGVTLYGTDGGAEIAVHNYSWEDTLRIYSDIAGVPAEIRPRLFRGEGHSAVVRRFINTITEGNWSLHSGAEGLLRSRVVSACYASAQQGREIVFSS
jgi:predicted dehydrogenase